MLGITNNSDKKNTIKSAEEQFRKLFREMPDAVIILDRKGVFLDVSNEAEKLSGYKKSDVMGKNLFTMNIMDMKTKALVIRKLALHFSGTDVQPFEIEIHVAMSLSYVLG